MITLLIFLLILISIVLMAVVLLQSSKGNGLAGPIGGSSVTMAFGVRRTSDLLSKSTSILAAILMVGCIAVNLMVGNTGTVNETLIQKNAGQQQQQLPPQTIPPTENSTPPVQTNQPPAEKDKSPGDQMKEKSNDQRKLDEKKKLEESAPMEK
ncbi:MAG: preprotein translocase subunit SecG [Bacteroidetes bacterium]|nr:preprotein translocase subunit SecG [Bacteroidota bacterium]